MESTPGICGLAVNSLKLTSFALVLAALSVCGQEATPPPEPVEFKLKQTFVNGLLVMPLASGQEAGQASKMNATVVPGDGELLYNQDVGPDMETALNEVQKYMSVRHTALPQSTNLVIAFEEKYSDKDGPSAAVACALLMESALTGKVLDLKFAVTGDMNADGSVQPIGGVAAKIRGATKGACDLVAVPLKNESSVADLLIIDGPMPLLKICVFSIKHFDEALVLAGQERDPVLGPAIAEFMIIRDVCLRDPRAAIGILRTPQAQARLKAVLQKAPNCLSAKHLLAYAQGQGAKSLSLGGSILAVDSSGQALLQAVRSDEDRGGGLAIQEDEVRTTINNLRNLRPKLDDRVWPYVDGMLKFAEVIRAQTTNPARSGAGLQNFIRNANSQGNAMNKAKQALMNNPQVVEELGL